MRCGDCKYWRRELRYSMHSMTHRSETYGACSCTKLVEAGCFDDLPTDTLRYYPHYEDGASLYTGEDFGCVHFEEESQ